MFAHERKAPGHSDLLASLLWMTKGVMKSRDEPSLTTMGGSCWSAMRRSARQSEAAVRNTARSPGGGCRWWGGMIYALGIRLRYRLLHSPGRGKRAYGPV